ncbi:hypothetical protein [Streptomyces sp. NPDC097640]|uniref:hypothetical protein n=1 Tax=Streptomyces sp. NPDC097640 TaxID=3157229 RepID=UPI00332920D6
MSDDEITERPEVGQLRMDTATNEVGIVVAVRDTDVSMKPPMKGAREWVAAFGNLRVATREEIARAYVTDVSGQSDTDGLSARDEAMDRLRKTGRTLAPGVTLVPHRHLP